jgi:ubiquinone/menaquinone biosynthesis C-methylase UbiE
MSQDPQYPFASDDAERERLVRQSKAMEASTERLCRAAGIGPGMRVLDLGSGSGDVAFLVASIVGSTGEVVGIERDPGSVAFACRRAAEKGLFNVAFLEGDCRECMFDRPFDAAVGRFVLMYQGDPTAAIVAIARHIRSGGVVAFQEVNLNFEKPCATVWPPLPLFQRVSSWLREALQRMGTQEMMGSRLYSCFVEAGLKPSPQMEGFTMVYHGPEGDLFWRLTSWVRSMLPRIVELGIATAAEIDVDTLEARLRSEAPLTGMVGHDAVVISAWATKP